MSSKSNGSASPAQPAEADPEYHGWFTSANKGVPEARHEDVTLEIDLSDVTSIGEVPSPDLVDVDVDEVVETVTDEASSPVLPQPAHRTSTPLPAGARRDERFGDLNTILREMRVILTDEKHRMSETDVDAVEWQLRTKIANL